MHSGSLSPIRQLTSPSEAGSASPEDMRPAEVMELTSPSETEQRPPKGCSLAKHCGRGKSRGRAASSSHHPEAKRAIHKRPKRRRKKNMALPWLQQPAPNQHDTVEEETSVSTETGRIAAAAKRTKLWETDAEEDTTTSEEGLTVPVASDSSSMPNSSGVFDYATWLVNRLTEEQRQKLTRHFSWMDLCAVQPSS